MKIFSSSLVLNRVIINIHFLSIFTAFQSRFRARVSLSLGREHSLVLTKATNASLLSVYRLGALCAILAPNILEGKSSTKKIKRKRYCIGTLLGMFY